MDIIQIDLSNQRHIRDFLELPGSVYRDIPHWVPPLVQDERQRLNTKRYPFFKHSEAAFFLVYQDAIPIGRLAVMENRLYNEYNREKTAFFYLFESHDDPAVPRQLFDAGEKWARSRGLQKMVGPKGFTALDGMGLLVKGFDLRPALGLPFNPAYYPASIESLGYTRLSDVVSGYLSADLVFPERIHELAARIQARRGLRIERFKSRGELRLALVHLKQLYNGALAGTEGGIPITDAEVRSMANQILWFADPKLIKMVMKGNQPVGFLLAYPDISAALQQMKGRLLPFGWLGILQESRRTEWININGAGMIKEYRGLGGTAILYSELFKSVRENPRYRHAEVVQIGTENAEMQREMENFGIDFYKMHRMYSKDLS